MKINPDENYLQAKPELTNLMKSAAPKNAALNTKPASSTKAEQGKKENKENMQGGLQSKYLDRTQPNRGKPTAKKSDAAGSSGDENSVAAAKSKGAIAKLDVSNVENEVRKLKEKMAKLQREIAAANGDENKTRAAKVQLAQIEAEIKQKDNKNYKIANGKRSTTPM